MLLGEDSYLLSGLPQADGKPLAEIVKVLRVKGSGNTAYAEVRIIDSIRSFGIGMERQLQQADKDKFSFQIYETPETTVPKNMKPSSLSSSLKPPSSSSSSSSGLIKTAMATMIVGVTSLVGIAIYRVRTGV
jgi:hypothetical protein